ncbi:MAG TPA: hypothetical protein VNL71_02810, partial [Chloroflexota bacterium]|nr:hypothetical protein [Chloroflexota bacterium]
MSRALGAVAADPPGFRRTRAGLLMAAFLAPFSASHIAGPLTVGRAAALGFGCLLAADLLKQRPTRIRLEPPALLLAGGYVATTAWIYLNMVAWGGNSYGKAGGFFEFASIGLLSLTAIDFVPSLRRPALLAALGGLVLAAVLALAGVGALNSSTVDLTQTGGRLSGTYGNADELGFAVALGVLVSLPFFIAARQRVERIILGGSIVILAVTLLLTYSRGAIITAGVGVFALALREAWGSRRRVAIVLGAAVAIVAVGAALYSVFEQRRQDVSFNSVPSSLSPLVQRDESGWDSRALGPIPNGPSRLTQRGGAIAVGGTQLGEGSSIRWGEARPGSAYTLRFKARAVGPKTPLHYMLADPTQSAQGVGAVANLGPPWRTFSLTWRPRLRSPHASLYFWLARGAGAFELSEVKVVGRATGLRTIVRLPSHL